MTAYEMCISDWSSSVCSSDLVAGAAFDVFVTEPAKENVLFGNERFIATPHLGASTNEAQENVALQVAEQISDYLLSGAVTNALNMPSVSAEDAPKLRRSEEHTSELQSLMRISYAVFCLKKKTIHNTD